MSLKSSVEHLRQIHLNSEKEKRKEGKYKSMTLHIHNDLP